MKSASPTFDINPEEFYTAVLTGQTELLGNMTEGQRQALLQVITLMRELGIELPAELEAAFANVDQAQIDAGEASAQATEDAKATRIAAIEQEKSDLQDAFAKRKEFLEQKIKETSGAEQQSYRDMLTLETSNFTQAIGQKNDAIAAVQEESTHKTVAMLEKERETLKSEYEKNRQSLIDSLKGATESEREAILGRLQALDAAYLESDAQLAASIQEGGDGVGTALESNAQNTVDSIEREIATLNSAWAARSAELKDLIANSTGEAQARYQEMYETESGDYTRYRDMLTADLIDANQSLLDAQDASAEDFIAAQEAVGAAEAEALGGVFEILRQVLGPDAEIIISMIQGTYDKRRAAYLAEGQATADAAGQANQSELDALGGVYETLRAVLGPDAEVIISMIQKSYQGRQEAYGAGGEGNAEAATLAAESEAQSVANINQLLRDLFGEDANEIIEMIKALGRDKAAAYGESGQTSSAAADAAAATEAQSIANINQLLRDLFGEDANVVIEMIKQLGRDKAAAYGDAGTANADAVTEGSELETQAIDDGTANTGAAIENRTFTIQDLLARGDLTPELRASLQALDKVWAEGGDLTAAEIAANKAKVEAAINERGTKIQALVQQGVPLAEAVRQVDLELAATFNEMGAEVASGATAGGELAAQGISTAQQVQISAIDLLKSGLFDSATGIGKTVTPAIAEEHRALMQSFIDGAQTSEGGVSAAEQAQIAAMQQYQTQLDGAATTLTAGATPAVLEEHRKLYDAFIQGAQESGGGIDAAEAEQIAAMQDYQAQLEAESGTLTEGSDAKIREAHTALGGSFTEGAQGVFSSILGSVGTIGGGYTTLGGAFSTGAQTVSGIATT